MSSHFPALLPSSNLCHLYLPCLASLACRSFVKQCPIHLSFFLDIIICSTTITSEWHVLTEHYHVHTVLKWAIFGLWYKPIGETESTQATYPKDCINEDFAKRSIWEGQEPRGGQVVRAPVSGCSNGERHSFEVCLEKMRGRKLTGKISEQMVQGCVAKPMELKAMKQERLRTPTQPPTTRK